MKSLLLILLFLSAVISLKAQNLFGRDWKVGKYYTTDDKIVSGLIAHDLPKPGLFSGRGDVIFYKKTKSVDKVKISSDNLKAFVMGKDSFVVSHVLEKIPFLQVMVNRPTKLYFSSVASQASGGVGGVPMVVNTSQTTYYYGENPDSITELDRKSFIEVMSRIMADKPDVVEAIKKKEYTFGSIYSLIDRYYGITHVKVLVNDDIYN